MMAGMQKVMNWKLATGLVSIYASQTINPQVLEHTIKSPKLIAYLNRIPTDKVQVTSIELLSVQTFGGNNRIGFINLRCHTKYQGRNVPSYVFLRGDSVAVLVLLNGKHMLLVQQYRVPALQVLLEAPAGMLDDETGNFAGVAAKQIEEQTGIKINKSSLISLGHFYPSPGGCDQRVHMYWINVNLSKEELQKILAKTHGEGEHQFIKVKAVDFNLQEVVKTRDAKLMALTAAYMAAQTVPPKI